MGIEGSRHLSSVVFIPTGPSHRARSCSPASLFSGAPGACFGRGRAHAVFRTGSASSYPRDRRGCENQARVFDTETGKAHAITPEGVHPRRHLPPVARRRVLWCARSGVGYRLAGFRAVPPKAPASRPFRKASRSGRGADGRSLFVEEKDAGLVKVFQWTWRPGVEHVAGETWR